MSEHYAPGTEVRVMVTGFYFIGTVVEHTDARLVLKDVEKHNPADTSVVMRLMDVRLSMRAVHSVCRVVNGCPVIWERGDAVVIDHPQGFMLYIGARVGTYKTLAGAKRRAAKLDATKVA